MKFSVITVCLNAGERLLETVQSTLAQTDGDFEILIKDGGSTDGALEKLPEDDRIRVVTQKDKSIYDAMNQAVQLASGEYFIFMNCGDLFMDEKVLENARKCMDKTQADIFYGNQYLRKQKCTVPSPKEITDFVCYRNIPCHQVCFYHRRLFEERGYDLQFPVRADYEHFLWCKYRKNAKFAYMDFPVSAYEGDGFSETKENIKAAKLEHKKITGMYIGTKCILYKMIMIITLQPLRKKLADSEIFSGMYQKIKGKLR